MKAGPGTQANDARFSFIRSFNLSIHNCWEHSLALCFINLLLSVSVSTSLLFFFRPSAALFLFGYPPFFLVKQCGRWCQAVRALLTVTAKHWTRKPNQLSAWWSLAGCTLLHVRTQSTTPQDSNGATGRHNTKRLATKLIVSLVGFLPSASYFQKIKKKKTNNRMDEI